MEPVESTHCITDVGESIIVACIILESDCIVPSRISNSSQEMARIEGVGGPSRSEEDYASI